jgi:hypothetical protein
MSRLRKSLLAMGALLLLLLIGAAWWLHGNLDAIVKRAIDHYGTQMTQARVSVDSVSLRTTDGVGVVRGLVIGNPSGFRSPHAIKVNLIEFAVDVRTLADPVIHIHRIVIESPDVNYEKGEAMTNFDAIQRNIGRTISSGADDRQRTSSAPPRKLIVDELVIRNARAHATSPALLGQSISANLPDVSMRDIGKKEGGITPAQLGERVSRVISQRLVASLAFERAFKSLGDTVKGIFGR